MICVIIWNVTLYFLSSVLLHHGSNCRMPELYVYNCCGKSTQPCMSTRKITTTVDPNL